MDKIKNALKMKRTYAIAAVVLGGLPQIVSMSDGTHKAIDGVSALLVQISNLFM